ncbi:MAG: nucleoid-associated protein [Bacteroidota bacterium]
MFDFKDASLAEIVLHKVGNKIQEEPIVIAQHPISIDEITEGILQKYFLSSFKTPSLYTLHHGSDLTLNEVYSYVSSIFNDPQDLYLQSVNLANHLYESADHPNIKGGEFYVAFFENCGIDGEWTDVIGLFKTENKETYLKIYPKGQDFEINSEEGININKLDKGCLIFNTEKEKGYKVAIIDNTNRGGEAQYWKEDFLNLKPREDSYYHTENYLNMCRDFAVEAFPDAARIDQIGLVKESVNYFKDQETFEVSDFEQTVMKEPEVIEAFQEYKDTYQQNNNISTFDEFDISKPAVKQSKRFIRSVIKLDKNFHVYVHGNRDRIIRGYDEEKQMHFYQLFFNDES